MRPFSLATSAARTVLSRAQFSTGSNVMTIASSSRALASKRAFSSFPQLRPSILPTTTRSTVFRSANNNALSQIAPVPSSTSGAISPEILDLVPKTAITAHPAFAGVQIRCGPRPTMARTSRLVRKRRHGFLSRIRTRNGRRTLQRRREKKRSVLSM
ncbi:hypothetical protein MGN70_004759 [Eutypa lata]|nr:hypothetical protein MGN70_004759 [Eutypa lata]